MFLVRLGVLALAVFVTACGGDSDSSDPDSDGDRSVPETTATGQADGGGDDDGNVVGLDLGSLGSPPDAAPQTAVALIDSQEFSFDATELGSARCEVASDSIAVNIGQSEDWFAFVATRAGDAWSVGPSFALEDMPQHEGLTPRSQIFVDGQVVTFQGEIVIKEDPTDFASWERSLGSVTVNCGS